MREACRHGLGLGLMRLFYVLTLLQLRNWRWRSIRGQVGHLSFYACWR